MQDFIWQITYQSLNLGTTVHSEVHHPFSQMGLGCRKIKFPLVLDTKTYNAWYYIHIHIFKKQLTTVDFKYRYACSQLLMRFYCLQLGIQKMRNIELKTSCEKSGLCHLCNNTQVGVETLPRHSAASGIQFSFPSTSCSTHFITFSTATNEVNVLQAISLCAAKS